MAYASATLAASTAERKSSYKTLLSLQQALLLCLLLVTLTHTQQHPAVGSLHSIAYAA